VFTGRGDQNSEKLLDLAGFSSSQSRNLELKGFGTGFAVSPDGYLISASHVTEGCDAVRVIFKNGQSLDAIVIKEESKLDLVLLKVDVSTPSFLKVASRTSGLGDDIYTIGYPSPVLLGVNQKFTKGSISALSGLQDDSFRYQISIPIQPGNSGGPVVCEENGDVVGIVVSSLKGKEIVGFNPQNVNYALKSGFIKPIMDSFEIQQGQFKGILSKNERRKRVVDATCMIVTCKFVRKEQSLDTSLQTSPKDLVAPILKVLGDNPLILKLGQKYSEPGVVSDGGEKVFVSGNLDNNKPGKYLIIYSAKDAAGNEGKVTRSVIVEETRLEPHQCTILVIQDRQPGVISFPLKFLQSATSIIGSGGVPDYEFYVNGKLVDKVKKDVPTYKIKFMGSGESLIQVLYRNGSTKTNVWESKRDFEEQNEWTVRLR
jgi:hypothetical protein